MSGRLADAQVQRSRADGIHIAARVSHKPLALAAAVLLAVSFPLALAASAGAAPTAGQAEEEKQLGAEAEALSPEQQQGLVRTLNAALLAGGVHPDDLTKGQREQIAQLAGVSVQQVNTALASVESSLGKDNPTQVPVGQVPVSMPIVFIFVAAAMIFAPSAFASIAATLFGDGAAAGVDGIVPFGQ